MKYKRGDDVAQGEETESKGRGERAGEHVAPRGVQKVIEATVLATMTQNR